MILLIGILYAILFVAIFHKPLKLNPTIFYIFAALTVVLLVLYKIYSINKLLPDFVATYVVQVFRRGAFTTALFSIVMYTGAFTQQNKILKMLRGIRAELSIFACILTLGHNFSYGLTYFTEIFNDPTAMKPGRFAATILTFMMMTLMLILMITSFRTIRRKMSAKTWKNIQRLAYPFYMLIYVHVMTLFCSSEKKNYLNILLYSVLFLGYATIRIKKAIKGKAKEES